MGTSRGWIPRESSGKGLSREPAQVAGMQEWGRERRPSVPGPDAWPWVMLPARPPRAAGGPGPPQGGRSSGLGFLLLLQPWRI